ncbi:MAG: hypothetical protein ACLUP5_02075 [Streptococcus sp.]
MTPQVMDIHEKVRRSRHLLPHRLYHITQENADILKRQITEGHAIANHSLSHNFNLLYPGRVPNQSQITTEVNQTMANFQGRPR